MSYQIQQIIAEKGIPVSVTRDDLVSDALTLMIEHDFSQLPVIRKPDDPLDRRVPEGMITYESILRATRNFKAGIDNLRVRDVMAAAPVYSQDHDLFDILDRLKETNAVLVTEDLGAGPNLVGIVTSYDATEYFRTRTEDLMRVEDIEVTVKDFIRAAYMNEHDELDQAKLDAAVAQITPHKKMDGQPEKPRSFDDLTLHEFITLLILKETWPFFEPIFGVPRGSVNELLQGVRQIRNSLAHFRGDITVEERDKLKFAMEWLARCQEEYQARLERERLAALFEHRDTAPRSRAVKEAPTAYQPAAPATGFALAESAAGGRGYAALADWLQGQSSGTKTVQLTFEQVKQLIGSALPASARHHRAWWANDARGHRHAQLWLEAGWRTTHVNVSAGRVSFSRIQEARNS